MEITISKTPRQLGKRAAKAIATLLQEAVARNGSARLLLSTGASQFETMDALVQEHLPWGKIEMFHLDEYIGLPETHKASFRKYLKERFVNRVPLKNAYFVNGEGNVEENIATLTAILRQAPIDVGVIGIGENGHIAFNDPPADFENPAAYTVVQLDDACKNQQAGEGWFTLPGEVPPTAITMTVRQILQCQHIISCVPHAAKARAVKNTLTQPVNPSVPAT
ncbi:6-phosphogluconolactonase, partial [Ruminococcaceae bacterium OttesenSCG-928-A16]|nr:6-phosphogluconolactonase [Ruminococcaceae bacterium OttesenSCG-928-A16]